MQLDKLSVGFSIELLEINFFTLIVKRGRLARIRTLNNIFKKVLFAQTKDTSWADVDFYIYGRVYKSDEGTYHLVSRHGYETTCSRNELFKYILNKRYVKR